MDHTVTWIPERYEVSAHNTDPVNGLVLDGGATEAIYFESDDEPQLIMLVDSAYSVDNSDDMSNVIVDYLEVPDTHVWYVWPSDRMTSSADFTAEQEKRIDTAIVASMVGFMSARIETYRRQFPDKEVFVGVQWMTTPPYFALPS